MGEAEAEWTARARAETVRALEAAGASAGVGAPAREEEWDRVQLSLEPGARAVLDEALAIAGKALGAGAPVHQRLEAICQEFLGAYPGLPEDADDDASAGDPVDSWLGAAKAALEEELGRWEFLAAADPVAAPATAAADGENDPAELTPSQCVERIALHFVETWAPLTKARKTLHRRVLDRDAGARSRAAAARRCRPTTSGTGRMAAPTTSAT